MLLVFYFIQPKEGNASSLRQPKSNNQIMDANHPVLLCRIRSKAMGYTRKRPLMSLNVATRPHGGSCLTNAIRAFADVIRL